MEITDWTHHRKHRAAIAEDEEQYIGLFDETRPSLMDCPPVLSPLEAPQRRNTATSFKATFAIMDEGTVHPIVDELVTGGATVDHEGKLVAVANKTRFIVVERKNYRRAFRITHVVESGDWQHPHSLEVHGVDILAELDRHVAWSAPTTITGEYTRFERDWVGPEGIATTWNKPRDLQDMKMITSADGVTLGDARREDEATAEKVIRKLITRSLEASWRATGIRGIIDNPPIVVSPIGSPLPSPNVLIRPADGKLLETVAPIAEAAGVSITANFWLPGDPPAPGLKLSQPTIVVEVRQVTEVNQ